MFDVMQQGLLVTVEGVEGVGKSTVIQHLGQALSVLGYDPLILREPGGDPVSEQIRTLVKDPSYEVCAETELLLYEAARAQLVRNVIRPELEQGRVLLLDRFTDSTVAYQSAGRGLPLDEVQWLNRYATQGVSPNLTLVLAAPRWVANARVNKRGEAKDRLEQAADDFFERAQNEFLRLVEVEPDRVKLVNANQPVEYVRKEALDLVIDQLSHTW
jgi:dTMP kinase